MRAFVALAAVVAAVDFFKLLNISEFAEPDEIKQAYRQQSKIYHPDKFKGDKEEAQERMVQINEAYRVLQNQTLRRMYEHYEDIYEEMADYEMELVNTLQRQRRGRGKAPEAKDMDPYMYNGDVRPFWRRFNELTGKSGRIWVVMYHVPGACPKETEEFARFARSARKSSDLAAGAINCAMAGGACQMMMRRLQERFQCKVMMAPAGQFSSELEDIDWVEYDQEYPRAEEVARVARKKASSRVINVDAKFFQRNISTNPSPYPPTSTTGENGTNATEVKLPLRVWVAWVFHPEGCRNCAEIAGELRKLSNQFKSVRFAILNCKEHKDARLDECRGLQRGGQSLKLYPHRPGKRFVESFPVADGPGSFEAGVTAALRVLDYIVKPLHPFEPPPHPYGEPVEERTAAGAVPTGDVEKWTVKQLREFIAGRGAKCVGCADKADFVKQAKQLLGKTEL